MTNTIIDSTDKLPLTCSRRGTCCFGKQVLINPWELATLAMTKKMPVNEFIQQFCDSGGTRLLFNGIVSKKGEYACSQYIDGFGCSLHAGRPLVCRLYPVGRRQQNNEVMYIYEGDQFPCINGCPEVTELPFMNIDEYLQGQQAGKFEQAHDMYLELMQGIADTAFALLLETGMTTDEMLYVLKIWTDLNNSTIDKLVETLNAEWRKLLIEPETAYNNDPEVFTGQHATHIQSRIQQIFNNSQSTKDVQEASVNAFASALLLAFSLGVELRSLGEHWIKIAETNLPKV